MATPAFNPSQRPMKPEAKKFLTWLFVLLAIGVVFAGYYIVNKTNLADSIVPGGTPSVSLPAILGGNKDNTINVCVVTWGGYAGGQYFNGGFTASKESRYYKEYGLLVNFKVIEDFGQSRQAWKSGECQLLWQTFDAFPTEASSLRKAGYDPQFVFQSDWSRKGDVVVVAPGIRSVNAVKGQQFAAAYGTPSHTLALRVLDAGGMTVKDVTFVPAKSAPEAAKMFKAGRVKVAAVWSPDDIDSMKAIPGARRLVDTGTMKYAISDGFFVDKKWESTHQKQLDDLIAGWLTGAAEINADVNGARAKAIQILASQFQLSTEDATALLDNVRLTTYGDNKAFFSLEDSRGIAGGVNGEQLYRESVQLYRKNGFDDLVPDDTPEWREVIATRALRAIADRFTDPMHAAESAPKFSSPTKGLASVQALSSKPVSVRFAVGSAVLDEDARLLIEADFVATARTFADARIRIEGNTDSTGSAVKNRSLSLARAQSAADFLSEKFGFDRNRFVVVGNGSDRPVCDDPTPECMAQNRRTEFQLIQK